MMRAFHALKRHEEGQALVLACISMLVLCICLLATVNLTYAAKERVELQNSADAAAYTTAAVQARALNFFAYSNRAMTVHYAADMNLLAVLSYMAFAIICTGFAEAVLQDAGPIGLIFSFIFEVINAIQSVYFDILYVLTALAVPFTDGINYGMCLMQTAISTATTVQLPTLPTTAAQQSNPKYTATTFTNLLLNVAPATVGLSKVTNTDPTPSLGTLTTSNDPNAVLDRLLMTEITNSARNQWTAYGKAPPSITLGIIPRLIKPISFSISLIIFSISFYFGKTARGEWGSFNGGGGPTGIGGIVNTLAGGIFTPTEQVFSEDQLLVKASASVLGITFSFSFEIDTQMHADRDIIAFVSSWIGGNSVSLSTKATAAVSCSGPCFFHVCLCDITGVNSILVAPINAALTAALTQAKTEAMQFIPQAILMIPIFHFGQTPYARFVPLPHVGALGVDAGLFNQPPVVLMVTAPSSYLASKGQPFMGYFGVQMGALKAGQGVSDGPSQDSYEATRNTKASKNGFVNSINFAPGDTPYAWMQPGFHAMAAAMAYYHRPGDWREPPNLFNPFWGAKLMPIADYPTIQTNGTLGTLFTSNQLVH